MMYAVFPLSIVVLPEEKVALHLFEPRYKQLFQDYRSGKQFVILNESTRGLAKTGTLVRIEKVIKEFAEGIADIVVIGEELIEIEEFHEFFPGKLYSAVSGKIRKAESNLYPKTVEQSKAYFKLIDKKVNWDKIHSIFDLACELDRDEEFKLKLIECADAAEANRMFKNELKLLDKMHENEQVLSKRFFLN